MKSVTIVVEPATSLKREYKNAGMFVKVVQGAWPSMRISFDKPPSDDPYALATAQPLSNGQVFFPRDTDRFDSFWITGETTQGPQGGTKGDNLVLEVFDCAQPVVLLNDRRGEGWRFHFVAGGNSVASLAAGDTTTLYGDTQWGAIGTLDNEAVQEYVPRGFIGGGITANGPFNCFILQHLNKNGTRRAEFARWIADSPSIVGADGYGISFETDGQPLVCSTRGTNQSGATLLPWPLYGISIIVEARAPGPINDLQWLLYSRGS